jgi:hypothetical protein
MGIFRLVWGIVKWVVRFAKRVFIEDENDTSPIMGFLRRTYIAPIVMTIVLFSVVGLCRTGDSSCVVGNQNT